MPVPNWVKNLAIGAWHQIPNSDIASVDPSPTPSGNTGPSAKVITWTSFAVDTRVSKLYSVANGGHTDYSGNEVDALTLETETPSWSQVLAPTSNGQLSDSTYYSDGRPASRHTYYGLVFVSQSDRFMLLSGSRWQNGSINTKVDSYNIGANSYNAAGTHPDIPDPNGSLVNSSGYLAAVATNPNTGDVYFVSYGGGTGGNAIRWNRLTNTWTSNIGATGTAPIGYYTPSAWDDFRDQWLVVGSVAQNDDRHVYTKSSNSWQTLTFTGSAASTIREDQASLIYCKAIDRYFFRGAAAGGNVYQITPTTWSAVPYTTTGGAAIPVASNGSIGPFSKFLHVPNLGGAIYYPAYGSNTWFLKLYDVTVASTPTGTISRKGQFVWSYT